MEAVGADLTVIPRMGGGYSTPSGRSPPPYGRLPPLHSCLQTKPGAHPPNPKPHPQHSPILGLGCRWAWS